MLTQRDKNGLFPGESAKIGRVSARAMLCMEHNTVRYTSVLSKNCIFTLKYLLGCLYGWPPKHRQIHVFGFDHKAPLLLREVLKRLLNMEAFIKEGAAV